MLEETKVHADLQQSKAYFAQPPSDREQLHLCIVLAMLNVIAETATPPNFISEIFFLAAWSLHLGYMPAVNTVNRISRHLGDYDEQIREIEADQSWQGVSPLY